MAVATTNPDSDDRPKRLAYRPDIDGLRAVAVLLVVLYHLRTAKITGGYIGVDIFFVISGYLISLHIISDLDQGRFSLVDFYERRIRRIFPALITVLLAVAVLAYAMLLPTELKACAQSLLAALFSVSNFYFWKHTGYFDATNGISPLLHTWSLAVEEQFYLILPILLRLLRRIGRFRMLVVLSAIAVLSLIGSTIGAEANDAASFYMLHTRTWELLLGTLLALCPVSFQLPGALRDPLSLLGLGLIVWPSLAYNDATTFPGLTAVPPCLGAALVIVCGSAPGKQAGYVSRLLALPPLRFIGLISYSLYLWHWPLLVFSRTYPGLDTNVSPRLLKTGIFVLSIAAASLSWRFVETPFRYGRLRPSRARLFRIALASVVSLAAVATVLVAFSAALGRWPSSAIKMASYLDYNPDGQFREGSCFVDGNLGQNFDSTACLARRTGQRNDLLLGDSHAAELWYGLSKTFSDVNFMQATATGCKPLIEERFALSAFDSLRNRQRQCQNLFRSVYHDYLAAHPPDDLLISARWSDDDLNGLKRTLQYTERLGIRTILFGPMVEYDAPLPRVLAVALQSRDRSQPDRHILQYVWALDEELSSLAGQFTNVRYVSLIAAFCEQHTCVSSSSSGRPFEFDSNHYTKEGSVFVALRIKSSGGL